MVDLMSHHNFYFTKLLLSPSVSQKPYYFKNVYRFNLRVLIRTIITPNWHPVLITFDPPKAVLPISFLGLCKPWVKKRVLTTQSRVSTCAEAAPWSGGIFQQCLVVRWATLKGYISIQVACWYICRFASATVFIQVLVPSKGPTAYWHPCSLPQSWIVTVICQRSSLQHCPESYLLSNKPTREGFIYRLPTTLHCCTFCVPGFVVWEQIKLISLSDYSQDTNTVDGSYVAPPKKGHRRQERYNSIRSWLLAFWKFFAESPVNLLRYQVYYRKICI